MTRREVNARGETGTLPVSRCADTNAVSLGARVFRPASAVLFALLSGCTAPSSDSSAPLSPIAQAEVPRIPDLSELDPGFITAVRDAMAVVERDPSNGAAVGALGRLYQAPPLHRSGAPLLRAGRGTRSLEPRLAVLPGLSRRWPRRSRRSGEPLRAHSGASSVVLGGARPARQRATGRGATQMARRRRSAQYGPRRPARLGANSDWARRPGAEAGPKPRPSICARRWHSILPIGRPVTCWR